MHARIPHTPRELVDELIVIAASLEDFNNRYAGGRQSGLLLSELIHQDTPEEVAALTRELPETAGGDYLAEATTLAKQHAGVLRQVGLELRVDDGISQAKEILHDYEIEHGALGRLLEAVTIHVAELAINDFRQFTNFLHRLCERNSHLTPSDESLNVFSSIGDTLAATLERSDFRRKLNYDDHDAVATIDYSQQIVDLMHDLHLNTVGDYLSEIVHHAACGDLSDYLRVKRHGLLPHCNPGPASWHQNLSADLFEIRWQAALSISRDISAHGETGLSIRVCDHLLSVARHAYREIKQDLNTARPCTHFKQHGPAMLTVLSKALETIPTW